MPHVAEMKLFFRYQKLFRRMSRRASGSRSVRLARRWLHVRLAQMNILMDQLARSVFLDGLLKKEPNHFISKGPSRGLAEANDEAIKQLGWPLDPKWVSNNDEMFYRKVLAAVIKRTGREEAEDILQDILSSTGKMNKFWEAGKKARSGFKPTTTPDDEAKRVSLYVVNVAITKHRKKPKEFLTEEGEVFEGVLRTDVNTEDVNTALMNLLAGQGDPDSKMVYDYLSSGWEKADYRLIAAKMNTTTWLAMAKDLGLYKLDKKKGKKKSEKASADAARKRWGRFLERTRIHLRKALNNPADEVAQALIRILNRVGVSMETGGYSGEMPGLDLIRRAHRLVEMWNAKT